MTSAIGATSWVAPPPPDGDPICKLLAQQAVEDPELYQAMIAIKSGTATERQQDVYGVNWHACGIVHALHDRRAIWFDGTPFNQQIHDVWGMAWAYRAQDKAPVFANQEMQRSPILVQTPNERAPLSDLAQAATVTYEPRTSKRPLDVITIDDENDGSAADQVPPKRAKKAKASKRASDVKPQTTVDFKHEPAIVTAEFPVLSTPTALQSAPEAVQNVPAPSLATDAVPLSEPVLCKEQADLIDLIMNGRNVFYTGSAGCGKSTVLKAFVKRLRANNRKVKIIAPTGRAALDINGSTFWTYAGWTPDHMKKPLDELKRAAHGKFVFKRLTETEILVIDEISMFENHHFERLNHLMQEARGNGRAFGGVQLIVTGDFCQLPPVKPFRNCMICGRETKEIVSGAVYKCENHGEFKDIDKWAFRSSAWEACQFEHVNLTTVHRQSDRVFIDILEGCRMGKPLSSQDSNLLLNHESKTTNAVKLFSTREEVRRVNTTEFDRLGSRRRDFKCHDTFRHNEKHGNLVNKGLRSPNGSLLALSDHKFEPNISLKQGMLVVLLVNLDLSCGLVNGSQGVIVRWEDYSPSKLPRASKRSGGVREDVPNVDTLGGDHAVLREHNIKTFIESQNEKRWPVVRFQNGVERTIFADCTVNELGDEKRYSLLSRTQIPLIAAWAMSIHKSQGMTLNRVIVDLSKSFEEGQMYVALSRARSLDGLKVEGLGRGQSGGNEQVKEFLWKKFGIK